MTLKKSLKYFLLTSLVLTLFSCTTSFNEQLKNIDSNLKKTFHVLDKTSSRSKKDENQNLNQSKITNSKIENKKVENKNVLPPKKKSSVKTVNITTKKIEQKLIEFLKPVEGVILQPYKRDLNDGIDISAASGTTIIAVADGKVVAITKDTEQRSILILRHFGNLLTIYANISEILVEKGENVQAGQRIASISDGKPSFLHFEVREGLESVNPNKYIKY